MDKEYFPYSQIFFNLEKEENLALCKNIDEPWGRYAK